MATEDHTGISAASAKVRGEKAAEKAEKRAFEEGEGARLAGEDQSVCRLRNPAKRNAWLRGWLDAERIELERQGQKDIWKMDEAERSEAKTRIAEVRDGLEAPVSSGGDLLARTQALEELGRASQLKKKAASDSDGARKAVYLPIWEDTAVAVPNGLLRSALFGATAKGARRYMKGEVLATVNGITLSYTGESLQQSDLDVYEAVLYFCKEQPLGEICHVTPYKILKRLGRGDGGSARKHLDTAISRMNATAVKIRVGRYSYEGSLIDYAKRDEETGEQTIKLNPDLKALFEPDQYTKLDWSIRAALSGKPLALWLHAFFSSHAKPYPIKVETIHALSGSDAREMWKFRETLRRALRDVYAAYEAHGQSFSSEITDEDLVTVVRTPTKSQSRHLGRRKKPAH